VSKHVTSLNTTLELDGYVAENVLNSSDLEETTHQITLNFSDGVTKQFKVLPNKSILEQALEEGMPLLYQCKSGSCSSCICAINEGDTKTIEGESSTLLPSEYKLGHRLLCISQAQADCSFDLAYGSEVGANGVHEANVFIDSVEQIAPNTVRLIVELAEGNAMEFKPGQFMQVNVPGVSALRSYSPASTNQNIPKMEFLIRLIPGGLMSTYLEQQAEVDQVLSLTGPYGSFFFREEHKRSPHIFVAGGTGLAPILSIIDTIRQSSGSKPKMLLSFGCATPEALFYLDEIQLREQWLPTLQARICVDNGAQENHYLGNPVSPLQQSDVCDPNTVAYLCGPQPMINAATSRLMELGVKAENIFAEQFVASK
jgi:benzoate/toluate 1,2-dioxygenase reductase subunit